MDSPGLKFMSEGKFEICNELKNHSLHLLCIMFKQIKCKSYLNYRNTDLQE